MNNEGGPDPGFNCRSMARIMVFKKVVIVALGMPPTDEPVEFEK